MQEAIFQKAVICRRLELGGCCGGEEGWFCVGGGEGGGLEDVLSKLLQFHC